MKKLSAILSLLVLAFVLMGADCKGPKPAEAPATPAALAAAAATVVPPQAAATTGVPVKAAAAAAAPAQSATGAQIAVIETNKGKIKFEFFKDVAPNTCDNFIKLTNKGFYNGLTFHRYEPGFVIQGGDPVGNGTGGPGYTIKAEFNDKPHIAGAVAMARAMDPDSAGSQFYICLAPARFLDRNYTVFGQVIEGMDVVLNLRAGDRMKKVYIENK